MNYVFFIGGSGARAYTAFLHSCAAGIISTDQVKVMLLDADAENAACKNSIELFQAYRKHRDMLHNGQPSGPAFHCDIQMFQETVVSPIYKDITYLRQVARGNNVRTRALQWFYTKEELDQKLEKGFYAHPNIGCMFFQDFGGNPHLDGFLQDIVRDLGGSGPTNVIFVGSVFGGTGAAGIPSVLKILRERCRKKQEGLLDKLHCCGVLVTPYFQVAKAPAGDGLTIDSNDFYGSTKTALSYYQFTDEFEKIYLVGQKTLETVNNRYVDGGKEQKNKPHIVEVLASLAIKDFLDGAFNQNRFLGWFLDRSGEDRQISWDSLGADIYALGDMLRTQMVLETAVYPCAVSQSNGPAPATHGLYQWSRVYDTDSALSQNQLAIMQDYSALFFEWLYGLQSRYAQDSDELSIDEGIRLCRPVILRELRDRVVKRTGNNGTIEAPGYETQGGWRKYQQDFVNLVDTAEKIEYVVKKVGILLSALGVLFGVTEPAAAVGCAGLFLQLFSLSGHTAVDAVG